MHLTGRRGCQRGVTLIEVLVTVVIMAFGMLFLVGMQTTAIQNNYVAHQYTVAMMVAEDLADRMRANRGAVLTGDYHLAVGATPGNPSTNCGAAACTAAQVAAWDQASIQARINSTGTFSNVPAGPRGILPAGDFSVVCADGACTDESMRIITVYWDQDRTGATGTACNPAVSTNLACVRLAFRP